jgi:hypothetical protein
MCNKCFSESPELPRRPKLQEKDIYDEVEDWLCSEYTSRSDMISAYQNKQIYYGKAMRAGFDVMLAVFDVNERVRKPSEWYLTDLCIAECKLLWSAPMAFGQLAFYQNIVENYMKSYHWQSFNDDCYYGPLKYFDNHGKLPKWFEEDGKEVVYYLNSKVNLRLDLVLYCESSKDLEIQKYVDFIERCLSQQPATGLVLYWYDRTRSKIERKKPSTVLHMRHGGRQKPVYDVEDACLIPYFATKQTCRWFTKDGKYYGRKECLIDSKVQNSCVGCINNWRKASPAH